MQFSHLWPRMPEFPRGATWLNSQPLKEKGLRGKIILVYFFTSSCSNCSSTLPFVKTLQERYGRRGLVIIGVHTPEFNFERDEGYVGRVLREQRVVFPVVLDNKYSIWNLYKNRLRPGRYVVNSEGRIIHHAQEEDELVETEQVIREALIGMGKKKLPTAAFGSQLEEKCFKITPDVYLGFLRGSLGNSEDILPNHEEAFTDRNKHQDDIPYLHGHWKLTKEYLEHTRRLPVATEYLSLRYSALAINLVMGSDRRSVVEIRLDDQPVPLSMRGEDIAEIEGKTVVQIDGRRIYRLVSSETYHRGTLKILVSDDKLEFYVFSFAGCKNI